MSGMFYGAISFNQDISRWDTHNVNHIEEMFEECGILEVFKQEFIKLWYL